MRKVTIVLLLMIAVALGVLIGGIIKSSAQAQPNDIMRIDAKKMIKNLTYIKDSRTGLCFAAYNVLRNSALTTIPCNVLHTMPYKEIK